MAQDKDPYVHFTIKLLKGSFALNALRQDALAYHMIDHPDKLIAIRLTEYYESLSRGVSRPGLNTHGGVATPTPASSGGAATSTPASSSNGTVPASHANGSEKASLPKPTH